MKDVRAIILDFGNVIIDIDPDRSFKALTELIDKKNIAQVENGYLTEVTDKHQSGQLSDVLFINSILKYARPEVQAIDVIRAWNAMLLAISKDTLDVLRELKKKYPLYLLSNTNQIHIDYCMRYLKREHGVENWAEYFSHIVYSHEIKIAKPQEDIYIYIEQLASKKGAELLFIDDNRLNTEAAEKRGWQVITKPPRQSLRETLGGMLK